MTVGNSAAKRCRTEFLCTLARRGLLGVRLVVSNPMRG